METLQIKTDRLLDLKSKMAKRKRILLLKERLRLEGGMQIEIPHPSQAHQSEPDQVLD
jgi:hypothetical protein